MVETDAGNTGSEPVVDRAEKTGSIGLLLALALGLVGAAVVLALMRREDAAIWVQILLGLLAVIGVFALFAGAIGLVRFGARRDGHPLSKAFLDTTGEGVVVTDREGRSSMPIAPMPS